MVSGFEGLDDVEVLEDAVMSTVNEIMRRIDENPGEVARVVAAAEKRVRDQLDETSSEQSPAHSMPGAESSHPVAGQSGTPVRAGE